MLPSSKGLGQNAFYNQCAVPLLVKIYLFSNRRELAFCICTVFVFALYLKGLLFKKTVFERTFHDCSACVLGFVPRYAFSMLLAGCTKSALHAQRNKGNMARETLAKASQSPLPLGGNSIDSGFFRAMFEAAFWAFFLCWLRNVVKPRLVKYKEYRSSMSDFYTWT